MIQPIEKKNVADEVFEKMLNMIIEGDWKKGEMIPSENELREAFFCKPQHSASSGAKGLARWELFAPGRERVPTWSRLIPASI